jgi:hypothetical protein
MDFLFWYFCEIETGLPNPGETRKSAGRKAGSRMTNVTD